MEMASSQTDTISIHFPLHFTPQQKKIKRMGTSDGRDETCAKELNVYTLCNVVNKCIKNNHIMMNTRATQHATDN